MIMLMRIKSHIFEFQTASQSEIALKITKRSKYGNFNFVVEYPIWVSIKRTLTGKLAVDGQNLIYGDRFEEKVQIWQFQLCRRIANMVVYHEIFDG